MQYRPSVLVCEAQDALEMPQACGEEGDQEV